MTETLGTFEASLDALDVAVTHVDAGSVHEQLEAAVTAPAVGVPLDETFDDPDLSLEGTSIEVDPTPVALREATTGVTGAQLGIADYGSLVLTMTDRASELVSLFVERHVVVVHAADVVPDMETAIDGLHDEFNRDGGSAILATGPSATADMGALVQGAHGPREVRVLLVEGAE